MVLNDAAMRSLRDAPVSKETQRRGKRDLRGRKRDLLDTDMTEVCTRVKRDP